jgi:hypothetical protein
MSNAAGDGAAPAPHEQNAAYGAVVLDLVSLIEHAQNSLRLIEQTIDGQALANGPDSSADIIVLDDISPRYMKAVAALRACDASLGTALRAMLDSSKNAPCSAKRPSISATGT